MAGPDRTLQLSLLILRLTVFLVMFMWTLDKFMNPEHAANVYSHFYHITGIESAFYGVTGIKFSVMYFIGAVEMLILMMFLVGVQKTFSYGAVLLFHTISTLSSYNQYLVPFDGPNLLFFAAWPMLGACFALFLLRARDSLFSKS